ncbi:hypothetical protein [Microcella alkalica]|uniref:Uncharacterized protein n=1 Tax=Microcella alkalica TaxID=355930 RepID=A0A839E2C8_9MICO|nr:hypothetical protein [Microcella alkalica]MBA8846819.1 hypothetical protein [Microcella alkalica]
MSDNDQDARERLAAPPTTPPSRSRAAPHEEPAMTLPGNPTPSESTEKLGKLEGALLGVLGVMGALIVGGSLVVMAAMVLLGGNALALPE